MHGVSHPRHRMSLPSSGGERLKPARSYLRGGPLHVRMISQSGRRSLSLIRR